MTVRVRKAIWLFVALLAGTSIVGLLFVLPISQPNGTSADPTVPSDQKGAISCLGRIEPEDDVVLVGARSISGQPAIVAELRVKESDWVRVGQILAVLDSKAQLEAAWHQAQARIKLAEDRLDQVRAGAKPGDIAAQQAEIARLESELSIAEEDLRRNEPLFQKKVVSASAYAQKRLAVTTTTQRIKQAEERLNSLEEVRETDVRLAQSEVASAIATAALARSEFELSTIRSRLNGRVVKINAWPGEEVGKDGIMELAKTARMYAIAEVYETDVARVRIGQHATVSGDALTGKIQGSVVQIGAKVARNSVAHSDPAAFSDLRIVEVKVLLEESPLVENLIHAQVKVLIAP
jgi:HlyD family secretion protein